MNWVGGARSRIRQQTERKTQKEFFERRRLLKRTRALRPTSPGESCSKSAISQDLLLLQTLAHAHSTTRHSEQNHTSRTVQTVNLDTQRPAHHLHGGLDLELPMSPILKPSSLDLMDTTSSVYCHQPRVSTQKIRVSPSLLCGAGGGRGGRDIEGGGRSGGGRGYGGGHGDGGRVDDEGGDDVGGGGDIASVPAAPLHHKENPPLKGRHGNISPLGAGQQHGSHGLPGSLKYHPHTEGDKDLCEPLARRHRPEPCVAPSRLTNTTLLHTRPSLPLHPHPLPATASRNGLLAFQRSQAPVREEDKENVLSCVRQCSEQKDKPWQKVLPPQCNTGTVEGSNGARCAGATGDPALDESILHPLLAQHPGGHVTLASLSCSVAPHGQPAHLMGRAMSTFEKMVMFFERCEGDMDVSCEVLHTGPSEPLAGEHRVQGCQGKEMPLCQKALDACTKLKNTSVLDELMCLEDKLCTSMEEDVQESQDITFPLEASEDPIGRRLHTMPTTAALWVPSPMPSGPELTKKDSHCRSPQASPGNKGERPFFPQLLASNHRVERPPGTTPTTHDAGTQTSVGGVEGAGSARCECCDLRRSTPTTADLRPAPPRADACTQTEDARSEIAGAGGRGTSPPSPLAKNCVGSEPASSTATIPAAPCFADAGVQVEHGAARSLLLKMAALEEDLSAARSTIVWQCVMLRCLGGD